jgi:hypothetical protein
LADLAEGIDSERNPYPPFNLNELGPRTYIGGEPYNARTLVVFAAKHGPRSIPVGELVIDDSDGDSDRLCREHLQSLGFQFHELRKVGA